MFHFQSIEDYHERLQKASTSCVEAIEFYLSNIEKHRELNAFVEVYKEEALQRASELDIERKTGRPLKKLHGVVIAIKDVLCYKDHKVSAASKMLDNFTSLYTATALQFLLDEDAIVIGNCNCDEFAMGSGNENSAYGSVLNAADTSRVPGGSSGGSAVAVQADMCMISLGSDTGGSVRQPADFCGIIGFKPSYGSISRYGLIAYASSFDQIGIFGKNIADVSMIFDIMKQVDPLDTTMSVAVNNDKESISHKSTYRFCYFKQAIDHPSLDPEICATFKNLFNQLKRDGHRVEEIDFDLLDHIVPAYYVLTTAEASSNLARYDGIRYGRKTDSDISDLTDFYTSNRSEGFGKEVKRRIMLGTFVLSAGYYDAYFNKAQRVRRMLSTRIGKVFENYDAILSPSSPFPAFKIGQSSKDPTEIYLADIYTVLANLTGIPGVSLPLFSHSYSIPFGLQVMTAKDFDVSLLSISARLLQRFNVAQET